MAAYLLLLLWREENRKTADQKKAESLEQVEEFVQNQIEELIFSGEAGGQKDKGNSKRELQRARLRQALHRCSLGGEGDRIYVKEYIKEILSEHLQLGEAELQQLIPFKNSYQLCDQDRFEILLYRYQRLYGKKGFEMLCTKNDLDREKEGEEGNYYEISGNDLRQVWEEEGIELQYLEQLDIAAQRIYQELYGYSVCDMLISDETALDSVSGGCGGIAPGEKGGCKEDVHGCDIIYVMLHGKKIRLSFLSFGTDQCLAGTVKKLSRNHPRMQLSRRNCHIVASLQNNSRVVAARPPVSEGWSFYVRKFNTSAAHRIEELITDENAEFTVSLLRLLVKGCRNLVITGEQASGKTTLLKSLVRFIDRRYSIRVAESAFETRLGELYPGRNIHTMQEYGNSSLADAIALFKKTDTDVTICGEINEPKTAEAFIQISQSGGRFTMCTSHHSSTDKLICYMRNALLKNSGFHNELVAAEQVADAIHFDVHLGIDRSGHRYIDRITEIVKKQQGGYYLNEILARVNGCYQMTGSISAACSREIRAVYAEWQQEKAAVILQRGGSG